MICRESDRASDRFGRLRCLRFTAPKGARQRMGNYFYLVVAGAVAEPEKGVGGGASVHASPPGHRSGHIPWGTSRRLFLASKGPFQKGPFLIQTDLF